jgi:FkbM family methyltransferase
VKSLLKKALSLSKYKVVHKSEKKLFQKILAAYDEIRVGSVGPSFPQQKLSNLAFQANLQTLIEKYRITCVIDIGANTGQFAGNLRELGFVGRIISFEPAAKASGLLAAKAAIDKKWEIMPFALGNKNQTKSLQIFSDDTFSSFKKINQAGKKTFGKFLQRKKIENVQIFKLDKIVPKIFRKGIPRGLMIKTDTQGYDLEVLRGARKILRKTRIVVTEAATEAIYTKAPEYSEIFSFLKTYGFLPGGFYPSAHRADSLAMIEFEALFLRP